MGPIEFAFLSIWIIFGVVGWIRGFFKELGITLLLFATLLVIWLLDGRLTPILEQRFSPARAAEFAVLIYGGILILGVLMAYQGQTIVFPGKDPPGIEGDLFGILIGLFNGYLVVGTLWYYMNRFGYPGGLVVPPLTGLGMALVSLLPFNALSWAFKSDPTSIRNVLLGGLLFLLLLRVIR